MTLRRRTFLKLLSAAAAALTLEDVRQLVPVPPTAPRELPPIDWRRWHRLTLDTVAGVPSWEIDGVCVNAHPALVQKISRIVCPQTGATMNKHVRFVGDYMTFMYRETRETPRHGREEVDLAWFDIDGHIAVDRNETPG